VVKLVKWALTTIDYYTKDLQGTNLALRLLLKCSQCCIWCLEKTIRFITKYGYIFVAIEGSSLPGVLQDHGLLVQVPRTDRR